jgi:hypothetical protein
MAGALQSSSLHGQQLQYRNFADSNLAVAEANIADIRASIIPYQLSKYRWALFPMVETNWCP